MKTMSSFKLMLLAIYSFSCVWTVSAQIQKDIPTFSNLRKIESGFSKERKSELKHNTNTRTLNLNSSVSERLDSITSNSDMQKIIYYYDDKGNNIEAKFWSIIDSTSILKNDYKVVNQYNSKNQIVESYIYFLKDDTLRLSSKNEYEYFPNGLLKTKIELEVDENDVLTANNKNEYTYNANNKLLSDSYYYNYFDYDYNDSTSIPERTWHLNEKKEYNYNLNFSTIVSDNKIDSIFYNNLGKKTKTSSYHVNHDYYTDIITTDVRSIDSIFYDNKNNLISKLQYYKSYFDTIIKLEWKEEYIYSADDMIQGTYYTYNPDSNKLILNSRYRVYIDKSIKFKDIFTPHDFFEVEEENVFFTYKILGYNIYDITGTIITDDLKFHYSEFKTTSLEENFNENSNFVVFPNPATDKITIQLGENTNGTKISILTSTGNIITETFTKSNQETLAIDHLKSGLYIIKIENGLQQTAQKLVIK